MFADSKNDLVFQKISGKSEKISAINRMFVIIKNPSISKRMSVDSRNIRLFKKNVYKMFRIFILQIV